MSGRSYCATVTSYECEAPAGIRNGRGYASLPGVRRSALLTCAYCEEPVCRKCSSEMTPPAFFRDQSPVPVCDQHEPEDLAYWLGVA